MWVYLQVLEFRQLPNKESASVRFEILVNITKFIANYQNLLGIDYIDRSLLMIKNIVIYLIISLKSTTHYNYPIKNVPIKIFKVWISPSMLNLKKKRKKLLT